MEGFEHILLFKTNINCDSDKQLLHTLLDNDHDIDSWSIDMEDEDCVLRIISPTIGHRQIIQLLNKHGHQCCELT
ncbi:hypothetical protein INP83_01520 [Mucilaginibacter sp. 21P]|uniref:hypothetical protein n=1 Tax=Mucilaginibacter sp. 21P TaxID=2778902 RepID=UPI001C55D493|nr:hypothetical protein [Mucilaginibacter sp. 21P]QXV65804.1 hypothetical protein INP83_01520 [Mucilaginibacter sp. 21P]